MSQWIGCRPISGADLEAVPVRVHVGFIFIARDVVEGRPIPEDEIGTRETFAIGETGNVSRTTIRRWIMRDKLLA